ncbi:MAG: galactokinase [Phycisphaeraceae bacterium]|nr:galactokinase [Phycisphaeraceae bacterium]
MGQDHVGRVRERALRAFAREYGGEATWAAAAPGRVNLIGEHTDYNAGWVLPIAIDRVCVAAAAPAADRSVTRVYSDDLRQRFSCDMRRDVRPGVDVPIGSWPSYVLGVLAECEIARQIGNLDIVIASSVPLGSGLSSSASVEVAVATMLEQAIGASMGVLEKAMRCQRAEHAFAGVPCGIMDMLTSAAGRADHALLIDCESCTWRPVPLPKDVAIVVFNSNVRHSLAGGEYARRRDACEAAASKLGLSSLRAARGEMLDDRLTDEELRCARHVITENQRTLAAAAAMERGDVSTLGTLFAASHASLRDDYRVSCRELDMLVESAAGEEGVIGARMTGGGFGGCVVAVVARGMEVRVMERVLSSYRSRSGREGMAFAVRAVDGAGAV